MASENQYTARMTGGSRHEEAPWKPIDHVERSVENYERILGHAVLEGVLDAEEAYDLLGNYVTWSLVAPSELTGGFYG